MDSLNFRRSKDVFIFTLGKIRKVLRCREMVGGNECLMVNSYAVYDANKGTLKILNYEEVYASKYIHELDAFLWSDGEFAVAREDGKALLISK